MHAFAICNNKTKQQNKKLEGCQERKFEPITRPREGRRARQEAPSPPKATRSHKPVDGQLAEFVDYSKECPQPAG